MIVFSKTMITNAKQKYHQGHSSKNPNEALPWYPVDEDLNLVFNGENVKPDDVEVICLSNVSAWPDRILSGLYSAPK